MKRGVKFFAAALVALAAGFAFIGCSDGSGSGQPQVSIVSFSSGINESVPSDGSGFTEAVTCTVNLSNIPAGNYSYTLYWENGDGEKYLDGYTSYPFVPGENTLTISKSNRFNVREVSHDLLWVPHVSYIYSLPVRFKLKELPSDDTAGKTIAISSPVNLRVSVAVKQD